MTIYGNSKLETAAKAAFGQFRTEPELTIPHATRTWKDLVENQRLSWYRIVDVVRQQLTEPGAIPMILLCPYCGRRHIDTGEYATKLHHTHACQSCGMVWRPSILYTVGVQFLPGFKNAE